MSTFKRPLFHNYKYFENSNLHSCILDQRWSKDPDALNMYCLSVFVGLSVCPSAEKRIISMHVNNFLVLYNKAFIFHMEVVCDKSYLIMPTCVAPIENSGCYDDQVELVNTFKCISF